MQMVDRLEQAISLFLQGTLIVAAGRAIFDGNWLVLFISLATLVVMRLPQFIEKWYQLSLPLEFELAITFFIYATLFLGEVENFYNRFWWWDAFLHGGSAIGFGMIAFFILYSFYATKKLRASAFAIALFSFTFSVAIGALWEIFEFLMDATLNTNMQRSGLIDTMGDMMMNSLGALVTSIAGFAYIKGGKTQVFATLIDRFIEHNPSLFIKKRAR